MLRGNRRSDPAVEIHTDPRRRTGTDLGNATLEAEQDPPLGQIVTKTVEGDN